MPDEKSKLDPEFLVDFSGYQQDMVSGGLTRMLSQHYDKCVLRQFVAVFLDQAQDLYNACIDLQQYRTVYFAEKYNLDALGRIVGADRKPWVLDENFVWFKFTGSSTAKIEEITEEVPRWEYYPHPVFGFDNKKYHFDTSNAWLDNVEIPLDRRDYTEVISYTKYTWTANAPTTDEKQGFDKAPFWVEGAVKGKYLPVDDEQYQLDIINKAIKNHTLVGSLQEVQSYIKRVTGFDVSFEKTGPNEVCVYVPANITQTALMRITESITDFRVDDYYSVPYPATLDISDIVYYPTGGFFIFDRGGHGFDQKPMIVLPPKPITRKFVFDKENFGFDQSKMSLIQQGAYNG